VYTELFKLEMKWKPRWIFFRMLYCLLKAEKNVKKSKIKQENQNVFLSRNCYEIVRHFERWNVTLQFAKYCPFVMSCNADDSNFATFVTRRFGISLQISIELSSSFSLVLRFRCCGDLRSQKPYFQWYHFEFCTSAPLFHYDVLSLPLYPVHLCQLYIPV